jgi:autotransporter-associated beta strand protein
MRKNRAFMPRPLSAPLSGFTSALAIAAVLAASTSARAQNLFWDTSADGNGAVGGTGVWNLTNTFWDLTGTDAAIDNIAWPNANTAIAVFQGTPGVVTLNNGGATTTANGLTFNVSGYTLSSNVAGDTLTLAGTTPTITTGGGAVARINTVLAGAGPNFAGNGTIILSAANTFTGPATIGAGATVVLNAPAGLGSNAAGSETIVASGGTLNVGGQAIAGAPAPGTPGEEIRISGTGVGGIGALINSGVSQQNALGKVVLTGDATINAGAGMSTSYNAAGQNAGNITSGRFDIRLNAAPGANTHLDLANFTLTKKGSNLMSLVNAGVSSGNIVVDEGQFLFEAGTLVNGTGTVTVNPNGKLGFFSVTAGANITRQIVVNGGTIGDTNGTGAAQTINAPIQIIGSNPNFVAVDTNNRVNALAGQITQGAGTITEVAKRGVGILAFTNASNSFSAPITVYAGTLRADYGTLTTGVAPTTTATPLGSAGTIRLAGGTLQIRADFENNGNNQIFNLGKNIVVDLAPSALSFDRITANNSTNKHIQIPSLTFAAPSALNGYSIGQNQLSHAQNTPQFRVDLPSVTMNSDTALATGDFSMTGDVLSANRNTLLHTAGNTLQFLASGNQQFNAFFNTAGTLRVGSGFGTPVTNDTVTVGAGTVYLNPGSTGNWRTQTNIAAGQAIDAVVSQQVAVPVVNFEQFSAIPDALRAGGTGVYGIGNATYQDIDLTKLGDGTWRIGAGLGGAGNGTINGVITPGPGNIVRMGGGGTVTVNTVDGITGTNSLQVGSPLLNAVQQTTSGTGTVVLASANDYTGGTIVNRGSTLGFRNIAAFGSGPIEVFGTIRGEQTGGVFTQDGNTNAFNPILRPGSTLLFDNGGLTNTTDINRWGDAAPVTLTSSILTLNSRNNNASTTLEQIGALNFSGGSVVNVNRQNAVAGNVSQLNVDSLNRQGNGTLEIVRSTGTSAAFGTANILLVTGTAPTVTNGIIAPHITLVDGTTLVNFANHTGSGIVNAAYTNTVNTAAFPTGINAGTAVVYVDFASGALTSTLGDNPDVYALKVGAGTGGTNNTTIASGAGTSIRIRSGGLIVSGDTTTGFFSNASGAQTTINPALNFNDGTNNVEAKVNIRGATNAFVNGVVTANGLTKFGGGNLILSANNATSLTGPVSVNQGTLELRAVGAGGAGMLTLAGVGSQLNIRINGAAATYTNGLTIAPNVAFAVLDVGNLATNGNASAVTFDGAAAGTQGLILAGSSTAQGQTLTLQTNGNGANSSVSNIVFGNNMANSTTGNATFNITGTRTLTLNNAPAINGTAPVITKTGDGTVIWGATTGAATVPVGTKVVVNQGTMDIRQVNADDSFGTGAMTSFELNGGTLALRRDNTAGTFGGVGTAYGVTVNGNSTILVDRIGAGTGQNLGLGAITIRNGATLTVNQGNNYGLEVPTVDMGGIGIIASNVTGVSNQDNAFRINGDVKGGALVKLGGGHLHLMSANNSYSGGTYINQGIIRARATNALGTGAVYLNPGGILDLNSNTNLGASQPLIVRSNSASLPMISVNNNTTLHPTANVDTSAAPEGIIGLSNSPGGTYDTPINMATLYGGGWSLGGVSQGSYDPRYTAASLTAGNGNLYRLGGGGTSFAMGTDSAGAARTNVLTGPNDVRFGFDSGNILVANAGNFQFSVAGTNDYSGGETVIHRGMVVRLFTNNNGTRSGLSNSAVDVFGVLSLSGGASLDNGVGGNVNAVTFHPGSALFLDSVNGAATGFGAANNANRWNDTTPIALNSAGINFLGANNALTTETVGDVTFSGGSRIRSGRGGTTGTTTLTLANLASAAGKGHTLQLQGVALGGTNAAGAPVAVVDLIKVAGTAPTVTNGMVSSAIVNASDNTFMTYNPTNGFANIVYDKSLNATYAAGSLLPTDKVDVITGALTLTDNPTVYALRTSQNINLGGPFNQMTIRSGGLIGTGGTISPNLIFNDGASNVEARIYVNGTLTINGTITANGITKFGHNATAGQNAGTLVINVPQPDYASGWTVNSGTLQINDPQGLGQSVPGNGVVLNGALTTGGQASMAYTQTQLNFNRDNGTSETVVFTGGPITVVNEATIRMGGGGDNKSYQIPNVTLDSSSASSSVALTVDVPNNRTRGTIPTLTLNDSAVVRVLDAGSTADTGRSVAAVVNSLVGTNKELTKIGNRTLELPNDNSATFTGGSITVSQGTLRVRNNGSLGSATTTTTIERNATLEIDTPNFTPTGTVTQLSGSIERWNREDARGTTYNLPAGVNLQLNTNLLAARTIGLNGGTLEGFLWTDHPATAVERTVGSAVTVNLLANSFVGQNVIQGPQYDAGRQPTIAQPFGDNNTGAFLRIDGDITGNFDLTKTGFDTVILGGIGNTYRNTIVDSGTVRLGVDDALPTSRVLTTRLNGVLDLYGFNQEVGGLGTETGGPNPGGVSVGSSGKITNSSPIAKTLKVNNTTNYTYNGNIERNVAVTKQGAGTLTLGGSNTYTGETVIEGGTLALTGTLSGSETIDVRSGATFDVSAVTGGPYEIGPTQTLEGSGTVVGSIVIEGNLSPGNSPGDLLVNGALTFSAGSTLTLEIAGPNAGTNYDQVTVAGTGGPITLNGGTVTLALSYAPVGLATYTVIDNLAATQIAGTFSNLADGGTITAMFNGTPYDFVADYQGGDGNDLVLTVPEPTSAVALLAGMGICAGLRRFRRRSAAR